MTDGWGISCEIVLIWMSMDLTDDKSTLVQVMAWCRQATSHYLSQCWPRSMTPCGITRPQWVKRKLFSQLIEASWFHMTPSTFVQVMACCLFHHHAITWTNADLPVLSIESPGTTSAKFESSMKISFHKNAFNNVVCKISASFFCLNMLNSDVLG